MVNTSCPRVYRYFSSFEDLLKQRQMDIETDEKNSYIPQTQWKICTNLVNLPGPYTSPETISKSLNILSVPIKIEMRVNMGTKYDNTASYTLFIAGQGSKCNGNLFICVSSGKICFGVQCNKNSEGPLMSKTTLVANKDYDLKVLYDGSNASIYVNDVLDVSAVKNFKYLAVEKITIGAGDFDKTSERIPEGASISKILWDKCEKKPKCENNCKKCNIPGSVNFGDYAPGYPKWNKPS